MRTTADSFWDFLDVPLRVPARLLLVALIVPLLLSFAFPLWQISMKAPQYPDGLTMDIYSYQVVGGNDGHDVIADNTEEIHPRPRFDALRKIMEEIGAFADGLAAEAAS